MCGGAAVEVEAEVAPAEVLHLIRHEGDGGGGVVAKGLGARRRLEERDGEEQRQVARACVAQPAWVRVRVRVGARVRVSGR